jgi:hypothetical protein
MRVAVPYFIGFFLLLITYLTNIRTTKSVRCRIERKLQDMIKINLQIYVKITENVFFIFSRISKSSQCKKLSVLLFFFRFCS